MHAGRDSVVGTATHHGLGDLGTESWWGDFLHPSRLALRATKPAVQQVLGLFIWGLKWLGHGNDRPPPSSAKVKVTVQLYLYFPSGPSWPVLG